MKKRVNVHAKIPVRTIRPAMFGDYKNIELDTNTIFTLMCARAQVVEILDNGTLLPLNIKNYDKDNNPNQDRVLQCRYLLAVIYCLSGRKKLADFELNKLLDTGYKPASVYASLAYVAWEQGKVDLSLDYYEKALEDDSENPTALNGLGYVLACEGEDLTKALSCCKKALDILPESAACLDSLGWVYYKMGLYSESKKFLNRAMKADSSNPIIVEHLQEVKKAEE